MRKTLLTSILLFSGIFYAHPCGWDEDTIAMEMQEFPTIHELITGKFLRHSMEFYYWRILDREEKLKLYPDSLHWLDDLGVAYDKVGEHQKAIDAMLKKDSHTPGLYETHANLGTFYIHNGQLQEGVEHIKKAIEINPDAHFGREVYQRHLVEYLILRSQDGSTKLPLRRGEHTFHSYLEEHHFKAAIANGSTLKEEQVKAIKGVAGMMRFGFHDSPVLLEAIGDLLIEVQSGAYPASGHLASRAYLKASFEVQDLGTQRAYHQLAKANRESTYADRGRPDELEVGSSAYRMGDLERVLKLEVESGDAWFNNIRNDELGWIEAGVNPDSAFAAKYYQAPTSEPAGYRSTRDEEEAVNERWMNRQQYPLTSIGNIHSARQLPDSTKIWLDAVYAREFEALPEPSPTDSIPQGPHGGTSEVIQKEEEVPFYQRKMFIFMGLILLVGGFLFFRDMKKYKEDQDS